LLNFQDLRERKISIDELTSGLNKADLVQLTNEMVDSILTLIKECSDQDVIFMPNDPDAYDPYAEEEKNIPLPWTLGHVIVHINASSEESAALASELARGVEFHGRSRYEVPWESVITIDECRQGLEESRRICLASLEMWPDRPHLENFYQSQPKAPKLNAVSRYVYGFSHTHSHLGQIMEIVTQAKKAR